MRNVVMAAVISTSLQLVAMEKVQKPKATQAIIGIAFMANEQKAGNNLGASIHQCQAIGFADENEQIIQVLPYLVMDVPANYSQIKQKYRTFFEKYVDTRKIKDKLTKIMMPIYPVSSDEWECGVFNLLYFRGAKE